MLFSRIRYITHGKYKPSFNKKDYAGFKQQSGFCIAYCQKNGQINGKSFEGDINYKKVMDIVRFVSKNKKNPNKIEEQFRKVVIL